MQIEPLVSVIIPTYNSMTGNKRIDKVLSSILDQTYKNIEIIVVDNHSSDDTKEICKRFPVRFFDLTSTRSKARNFGLERARGECVLFLDSDLVLSPTVLEECVSLAKTGVESIDIATNYITRSIRSKKGRTLIDCALMRELEVTIGLDSREIPNFYSKHIIGKNRFPELDFGEDYAFWLKISAQNPTMSRIKSPVYHYEDPSLKALVQRFWRYGQTYVETERLFGLSYLFLLSILEAKFRRRLISTILHNPHVLLQFLLYLYIKYLSFTFGYFFARLFSRGIL